MRSVYELEKIDKKTIGIREGAVRMFLLLGDERAMLIDTGYGGGDLLSLIKTKTNLPIIVVNSHSHVDHIGCNHQFKKIYAHPGDFPELRAVDQDIELIELKDKDNIDLGGRVIEVIHTPGHTPGAISFLDRNNRMLFSGDNIGDRPVYMFMEGQSLEEYTKSLEHLISICTDYDSIYACHGTIKMGKEQALQLLKCARAIMRGELKGEPEVLYDGKRCLCYRYGSAAIYGN
jgi:glyoxylase-like metal-dependent hydrolase (beta-lactamase superfamily II)